MYISKVNLFTESVSQMIHIIKQSTFNYQDHLKWAFSFVTFSLSRLTHGIRTTRKKADTTIRINKITRLSYHMTDPHNWSVGQTHRPLDDLGNVADVMFKKDFPDWICLQNHRYHSRVVVITHLLIISFLIGLSNESSVTFSRCWTLGVYIILTHCLR